MLEEKGCLSHEEERGWDAELGPASSQGSPQILSSALLCHSQQFICLQLSLSNHPAAFKHENSS